MALKEIHENYKEWSQDYNYLQKKNEYVHKDMPADSTCTMKEWFKLPDPE